MPLPALPPIVEIRKRLQAIFPDGTPNRAFLIREMAARTVFVMLYAGAIAGSERYVRPDQITRMTNRQAARRNDEHRLAWATESLKKRSAAIPGRWYAANTREPIRDETLRAGLIRTGAVITRSDLPTTSAAPRYALSREFAALFDPALAGESLAEAIAAWQKANLSAGALARIQLVRRGAASGKQGLLIRFPNAETRQLGPGASSNIAKAVVEDFATRFLGDAAVIFLSESGNRVVARDEQLAREIGLKILPDRLLPDIVLVDLAPSEPLLVFIEAVATSGPMSEERRSALLELATGGGFRAEQIAFVSAYGDRAEVAFRGTVADLAWGSFAWFASEPDRIIQMHGGASIRGRRLAELL